MKKTIMILAATLAATAAMAQTNQVLSRNVVGYVRIDIPANKLALIANPFVQVGTSAEAVTVPELFGDLGSTLPGGTQILMWNPLAQAYVPALYDELDGWTAAATNKIARGQGVFFKSPSAYSVYLMGEVPVAPLTNSILGGGAFNALGYAFPTAVYLTNTTMAAGAVGGDQVATWNVAGQHYDFNLYDDLDGWTSPNQQFTPGQGLFYKRFGSATSFTSVKPYTWP